MNTLEGARVPMTREGNHFVVEIKIEKKEDEHIVPKKIAARRWSSGRKMDVDEGKLKVRNKLWITLQVKMLVIDRSFFDFAISSINNDDDKSKRVGVTF